MCGLISIFNKSNYNDYNLDWDLDETCKTMLSKLKYRGPDEANLVRIGPVILGHTRLSIIDLITGAQPIYNEDKTIAVVMNGEIYNFQALRAELECRGHIFNSNSDTEVVVHLYEEAGRNVFSMLHGMFAIVIYDSKTNTMLAGRDRVGEKPLLYWNSARFLVIASEIKALLCHPFLPRDINYNALAHYLNCIYIPSPHTIFNSIKKLPPAHFMELHNGIITVHKYWKPNTSIIWGMKEHEAKEGFLKHFSEAVRERLVSDVPLGVFLSGGIDSSAVVAIMSSYCTNQIKTFSAGFANDIDERPYARMVAERYDTNHTELYIDEQIEDVIFDVLEYFDEPFGDSSAIPTFMISKEARKHVKVILTGDGGDELFAGYNPYLEQKYQLFGRISTRLFKEANRLTLKIARQGLFERFYPRWAANNLAYDNWLWSRSVFAEDEITKILDLPVASLKNFYLTNQWLDCVAKDALSLSYSHDINYYLPDDLLKKVDMASMFASLECRAPFLDHRLVEFSLSIPPHLKVKNDILKFILKESLKDLLPKEILRRGKMGFGAPVELWMRNQLRDVVNDYLSTGCKISQFMSKREIDKIVKDFYSEQHSKNFRDSYKIWLLFSLEVWMRKYI